MMKELLLWILSTQNSICFYTEPIFQHNNFLKPQIMKNYSKAFIIVTSALGVLSCSNDDSNSNNDSYLLDYVVYQEEEYFMEYYPNNSVKKFKIIDQWAAFTYENNRIISITKTDVETNMPSVTTFEHNANGKISTFENDGLTVEVAYDEATTSYSYTVLPYTFTFKITASGDVERVTRFHNETEQTVFWGYVYDTQNKGAMANSNAVTIYLYLIQPNSLDVLLPFTKMPIQTVYNGDANFSCENTFNSLGYIETISVFGNDLTFHYKED